MAHLHTRPIHVPRRPTVQVTVHTHALLPLRGLRTATLTARPRSCGTSSSSFCSFVYRDFQSICACLCGSPVLQWMRGYICCHSTVILAGCRTGVANVTVILCSLECPPPNVDTQRIADTDLGFIEFEKSSLKKKAKKNTSKLAPTQEFWSTIRHAPCTYGRPASRSSERGLRRTPRA
jgi:hypothetical protein